MLILLDRDGVINTNLPDSVHRLEDFEFIAGSLDAVQLLRAAGYCIAVCTNQGCVGRGDVAPEMLDAIHAHMLSKIRDAGGDIDRIYAATDHPDNPSNRRKPGDGMLQEALADFQEPAASTYFIGDSITDLQAAKRAGCPSILVRTGHGSEAEAQAITSDFAPEYVADNLYEAVHYLLGKEGE